MSSLFLVTDTHPLLWYMGKQDGKLPKKVVKAFKSAQEGEGVHIWVPAAVVWEISILMKKTKRITALATLDELVIENFYCKGMSIAEQQTEDLLRAHRLAFTKDPFDALIVATAQRMDIPLITGDSDIIDANQFRIFW